MPTECLALPMAAWVKMLPYIIVFIQLMNLIIITFTAKLMKNIQIEYITYIVNSIVYSD